MSEFSEDRAVKLPNFSRVCINTKRLELRGRLLKMEKNDPKVPSMPASSCILQNAPEVDVSGSKF